jgi:hypothetical protein
MPKWIGNRFGNTVPIAPDVEAPSAVYNIFDQYYAKQEDGWASPSGMTATGGIISEYEESGTYYRSHVFNDTGTMNFTAGGSGITNQYDVLIVGGGGCGGQSGGGGGGGAVHYRVNQPVGSFPTPFTCTIGAGGGTSDGPGPLSKGNSTSGNAPSGSPTHFGPGSPNPITADGGGGGGHHGSAGGGGGSGGGAGRDAPSPTAGGTATGAASPGSLNATSPPSGFGRDGGNGPGGSGGDHGGGGGGGANGTGSQGINPGGSGTSIGADGAPYNIANGEVCKYGAGGGGGRMSDPAGAGGQGGYSPFGVGINFGGGFGGGHGSKNPPTAQPQAEFINGAENTGAGGGGGSGPGGTGSTNNGGMGGSGQIVVRYEIGSEQYLAGTAKATGGLIYKSGSNIIHVFETSGKFVAGGSDITGVSWLAVGGGAAGSADNSGYGNGTSQGNGGGGAGALHHDSSVTIPASTSYTIQIGAGGRSAGINSPQDSFNGTPTVLGSLKTAAGGGSGGYYSSAPGRAGGSGGGGGATGGNGGTGSGDPGGSDNSDSPTNGWGNDGANGGGSGGGGGGGAGASGSGGTGGGGLTYNITGSDVVYAAGGGGSGPGVGSGGSSGVGGPGAQGNGAKGGAGRRNTGSGGGAGQGYTGSGGSGIVVISYPVS